VSPVNRKPRFLNAKKERKMKKRQDVIEKIETLLKTRPQLREEIDWQLGIDREYKYDLVDAFIDASCNIEDIETPVYRDRIALRQSRELQIELEMCHPVTDEELRRGAVLGRYKGYEFRLGGKKYRCKAWSVWEMGL